MSSFLRAPRRAVPLLAVVFSVAALLLILRSATAVSPTLVISQVYGGSGTTGATYTNDYIEIFNRGSVAASLNGLSLQYASATGTGNFGANATALTELPNVTLQPGQYFLVKQASGTGTSPLPVTADYTDTTPINLSGTNGKVALVNATTSLGCNGGSTACDAAQLGLIIDLIGYGNAPTSLKARLRRRYCQSQPPRCAPAAAAPTPTRTAPTLPPAPQSRATPQPR